MTRRLAVLIAAGSLGCAGRTVSTGANPAAEPATNESNAPSHAEFPPPTPPRIIPNVRIVPDSNAVPAFADSGLIAWGPEPAGTVHTFPPHKFDLQNQAVRVRFGWTNHAVIGSTTLRIAARDRAISEVPLNAVAMTIKRVATTSSVPLKFDYDGEMLTVHLRRSLAPHAVTSFVIDYETVKPKRGAYFIDRNHYMWTQGAAIENRYWLPTYDHPDDKTTWSISVTTDSNEKALSNGRLVSRRAVNGGVQWNWVQAKPASTYLMSVVTGNYTVLNDHANGVPVEYWTYPDSIAAARLGFEATPDAIRFFSQRIGIPYPWAKYAQSVAPDFIFGGMENVSATTQNDNGILHPAWADPQYNADGLVSHELSHQWFGDLLTTRDWSHAWLNEGFATFLEQIYREHSRGTDEAMWDRMGAEQQTIAADRRNRRPIVYDRYVSDPIEVFFSGHIYPKGATVLQMLRHQLGDSLFWKAINHYAESHMFGNVVTADLERAFEETTGRSFASFFKQWVYGAGFPVFRVSSSYDSASRQLALRATEIQPRDSLTGYFDASVDVEVLTDGGPVRGVMQVHDGRGELALSLPSAPRAIEWNKGAWVLAISDLPRSTAMLDYQLAHGDDVFARSEAITLLQSRKDDFPAVRAVATAAGSDGYWAVRGQALHALAIFAADSTMRALGLPAVTAAVRDSDSRIRQAAVAALASFPGSETDSWLASEARGDQSPIVRGIALASYLNTAGDAALPLARIVMAEQSWRNVLRTPALAVLKGMSSTDAQALYKTYVKE
ncbi:MAG: M1 family metallopeptidase [Gemmatimonadaceae bacterium]